MRNPAGRNKPPSVLKGPGFFVNGATVTYRNGHTALRDANFQIPTGTIAALVGVNGSGKSTLFKSIMGFVRLAKGEIRVLDMPVEEALRKNLVAYVPQTEEVDWKLVIAVLIGSVTSFVGNFPVLVEDEGAIIGFILSAFFGRDDGPLRPHGHDAHSEEGGSRIGRRSPCPRQHGRLLQAPDR